MQLIEQRRRKAGGWGARSLADAIGVFPNDDAIVRLVGGLMLETNDERAVARRHMSLETLARVTNTATVRLPALAA